MTEEREDLDQQEFDEGYNCSFRVLLPVEMKIRLKRKAESENISLQSYLRHALEAFLEEDDRVDYIVERSCRREDWDSWTEYLQDQKEQDEELYDAFTDEEIEDIFEQIQQEKDDELL